MVNVPMSDQESPHGEEPDAFASWGSTAREAVLILTQGVSHALPWLVWLPYWLHGIR
jgi:hypothetical protein